MSDERPLGSPAEPVSVQNAPVLLVAAAPPGPGILAAVGWLLVFFVGQLVVAVAMVVGAGLLSFPDFSKPPDLDPILVLVIGTVGTLLAAIVVVALMFRCRIGRVLGLRLLGPVHLVLVVLTVLPSSLVASEVNNWAADFLPSFDFMRETFRAFSEQPLLTVLLFGCLLPGLGEEIYFRGFLGRGLVARHGVVRGTLVASLLFGIAHVDPVQASSAAVLGIACQIVLLSTKSLLAPILLHALANAIAFTADEVAMYLPVPGFTVGTEAGASHTSPLLVLAAIGSLVTLGFLYYDARTRWVMPDGREWSPGYVRAEQPPPALAATLQRCRPRLGIVLLALSAYVAFGAALIWVIQSSR